ncbi:TRAF3-interacting protein 1 isoform X3 [Bombyx mandarina]|uniref:TRAF3-interacting protein 1 n=1 Tax=Bombyx mandarina TaxID=7092 RepID=A0A6J2JWI1_BOMMA|nr:TRAF3-interacting protein 1 isoform X3 [Bombyx mandarina]
MEKEIDPQIIKETQTSLGKYVKRPPLSEKLLKKPPFRFLHDIITSVLKTTGFFEGLFEKDELTSENVKDRESKIQFLNKVISVIHYTTGKPINIKPSKIVAGQEAEKTNELLQCLAQALDNNLSSVEAVKKYKENASQNTVLIKETRSKESIPKKNSTKNLISKSSDNLSNLKNEAKEKSSSKKEKVENQPKHENIAKNEPQNKTKQAKGNPKKIVPQGKKKSTESHVQITEKVKTQRALPDPQEIKTQEKIELNEETQWKIDNKTDNSDSNTNDDLNQSSNIETPGAQDQLSTSYAINEQDLNSSSSSQNLMGENVNEISIDTNSKKLHTNEHLSYQDTPTTDNIIKDLNVNKVSQEPLLINTKLKIENDQSETGNNFAVKPAEYSTPSVVQRPASVRPSSSRPGAPRPREKLETIISENENLILGKVNIIAEHVQNDEEEDNSIIIAEQHNSSMTQDISGDLQSLNDHGHLVQQIIDAQRELSKISGKTEIEWESGIQKARETQHQEIEQLKFNIQALSRVANPLGKVLDHLQEDVEVMRQELNQWTNMYEEITKETHKQKLCNEESLIPLRTKLKQLDLEIQEKQDKVNDLKVIIHKNSSRIEKLLATGNVQ